MSVRCNKVDKSVNKQNVLCIKINKKDEDSRIRTIKKDK